MRYGPYMGRYAGIIFLILARPVYKNVNNTGTKYVRIIKQTAF